MKYKICFLILHYQVIDETLRCINSIQSKIDTDNYHIIVVDNASPNHSGEILEKKYRNCNKITVILNERNEGFSKGNNIGFEYAKKLGCDFICMMNNDTEIIQDNFYSIIEKEFEHSQFAVLGPEIYLADGSVCSYPKTILKLDELNQDRKRIYKQLLKNRFFIESIHLFLYKYIGKLIHWNKIRHYFREEIKRDAYMENVRLHGCCLIFSNIYIQAFDGLEVRTDFYGEEDILFVRLIRHHMKSVYDPELKILHLEQAATSSINGKDYKKRRFVYMKHLETLDMLEKMYHEDLESLKDYI